jgi:hypothetical protein
MKFKDNSNDKKYFTMVPNFILNHSSSTDQALYLQMKRLVGDGEGVCYASEKYFKDKLQVGSKALKTSLQYLLEHKWIEEEGYRDVETKGGVQKVKTYLVKDIWKMNIDYYSKGVSESVPLNDKGVSESNSRGVQKESKGVAFEQQRRTREEEQEKKNKITANAEAKLVFDLFKEIKPSYEILFKRKHEWAAANRLRDKYGIPYLEKVAKLVRASNGMPYAPVITSPAEMEEKMAKLEAFWNQRKGKQEEKNKSKFSFTK